MLPPSAELAERVRSYPSHRHGDCLVDKTSNSPGMAFIVDYLKANGDRPYGEIRTAAEAAGYTIYPIMYGRAKALLGMITEDGRVKRRRLREEALQSSIDAQPYGMTVHEGLHQKTLRSARASLSETSAAQLSVFLERFKEVESERARYRAALLQVEALLRKALEASE